MTNTTHRVNAARSQALVACAVLAAALATLIGIRSAANDDRLIAWVHEARVEAWSNSNALFHYTLGYEDFETRLLLEELPAADYSRGGAYMIGSSNAIASLMPWELTDETLPYLHNYSLSSATQKEQFHFVRFLVEHENFLDADASKTFVVLGLFYGNAVPQTGSANVGVFANFFTRYGLFEYDDAEGITPVRLGPLERRLRTERIRAAGFLHTIRRDFTFTRNLKLVPRLQHVFPGQHYPKAHQEGWRDFMGPEWETEMVAEMAALHDLIAYLVERGARVQAVILPLGSWHDALPYPSAFKQQVQGICEDRGIPLTDWSDLLDDEDFMDSTHANAAGQRKLHDALLELTAEHVAGLARTI